MNNVQFQSTGATPHILLVYYTQEDVNFFLVPEEVVAPWRADLEAAQGYMVNADSAKMAVEGFICSDFLSEGGLANTWEQYLIPNTDLIRGVHVTEIYNFGNYI